MYKQYIWFDLNTHCDDMIIHNVASSIREHFSDNVSIYTLDQVRYILECHPTVGIVIVDYSYAISWYINGGYYNHLYLNVEQFSRKLA